jgi:primary-amine oxidase
MALWAQRAPATGHLPLPPVDGRSAPRLGSVDHTGRLSTLAGIASFAVVLCLLAVVPRVAAAEAASGPLDPLTGEELTTAFRVIERSGKLPATAFFPIVSLQEPPKAEVLRWAPGDPFRREAFAQVYDRVGNRLFEAVVDLRTKRLRSFVERHGVQPAVFGDEYDSADVAVRADARWREAMARRGIDPDDVVLDIWAPGEVDLPVVGSGVRLLRALSFFGGDLPNPYDRPIEGVLVTIDANRMQVVDVQDTGKRPVNRTASDAPGATRPPLAPLVVTQPQGPGFAIRGSEVSWQGWRFRVGFNPREGVVLHQIGVERGGRVRPVIYRLALDEIYVAYALPDPTWSWRSALDVGEYNLGQFLERLEPGIDVPANAVFLDEVTPSDLGSAGDPPVIPLDHGVALYERDAGVLWDRTDPATGDRQARLGRELVVTSTMLNGNYTYTLEYVFRLDGGIDVLAGATGTLLTRGVASPAAGNAFGTLVAPWIAAPSHQHFFNFRVDFDVDGVRNRLIQADTRTVPSAEQNAFDADESVVEREGFRDAAPTADRRWLVESTTVRGALGNPTAYELRPLVSTPPYSDGSYPPLHQAAFAQHALWTTRYADGELSAVGDHPNQGAAGKGLPEYVSQKAGIDGRDLAVWHTVGFTHEPTIEEYPVMARETVGFSVRPDGFFDANPALDLP